MNIELPDLELVLPALPEVRKPAAYSESASENIHVCTPERELALVCAFAPIGLDPCSNPTSTVGARVEWWGPRWREWSVGAARVAADGFIRPPNVDTDGLIAPWAPQLWPGEIVFLQPPYGKYIKPWIFKANAESATHGVEIVGLLPGRYDTAWFRALRPALICWYGRRIPYVDNAKPEQKDSAKFPSVFVYWGARLDRFHTQFKKHGGITSWEP